MNDSTRHPEPPKRRILVIDDDRGITTLCRRVLEQTGEFTVKEENDGLRAVETVRNYRPHLIFLDRKLPGKDGLRIASELGADVDLKVIPIVFVTGHVDSGPTLCGHPVLTKPMRGAELIQISLEQSLPVDAFEKVDCGLGG